jgi:hypothetical protein
LESIISLSGTASYCVIDVVEVVFGERRLVGAPSRIITRDFLDTVTAVDVGI